MALNTSKTLRQSVIYSVYVRNHTKAGTLRAVMNDLERIKALGTDIIWFLPLHPIGKKKRKGRAGSPYAISHYREINPEYGTMEDFMALIDAIHRRGMKCIIDVVYNHTAPDAWLTAHHPEFYYRNQGGAFGNRVAEWSDIIDLDFNQPGLWDYHLESLKMWAARVDGFRCDVAPLLPLTFWQRARLEVAAVNPACLWLAESAQPHFIKSIRAQGLSALSDGEIFQAFDMAYDYDVYGEQQAFLAGRIALGEYIAQLNRQDLSYPDNYVKLRFLENHDRTRAAAYPLLRSLVNLQNWTAFLYFQKGSTLIYAGQEMQETRTPSLFEKEEMAWDQRKDISAYLQRLYQIKKLPIMIDGDYTLTVSPAADQTADTAGQATETVGPTADTAGQAAETVGPTTDTAGQATETVIGYYKKADEMLVGIFPLHGKKGAVKLSNVPDGIYRSLIDDTRITVNAGWVVGDGRAAVFLSRFQSEDSS